MKIITGKRARARRVILYGPPGIGKTTWASSATKAVVLATEDGCDDIGCDRTPLLLSYADFNGALLEIGRQPSGYKTIVVDSADWLERLIFKQVSLDHKKNSIDEIGYNKGYQFALKYWDDILTTLDRLRLGHEMSIIFTSHATFAKVEPPNGETYTRHEPDLHKTSKPLLIEWADELLFANYKVYHVTKGEGFDKRNIAVGAMERILHTIEKPTHLAKSRIEMPDEIPFTWDAYATHVRASYAGHEKPDGNISGVVVDGSSKPKTEEKKDA